MAIMVYVHQLHNDSRILERAGVAEPSGPVVNLA